MNTFEGYTRRLTIDYSDLGEISVSLEGSQNEALSDSTIALFMYRGVERLLSDKLLRWCDYNGGSDECYRNDDKGSNWEKGDGLESKTPVDSMIPS
jgi:hypothetical protein